MIAIDEAGEPDFARLQSGIKGRVAAWQTARLLSCTWCSTFSSSTGAHFSASHSRSDDDSSRRRSVQILASDFSAHTERDGVAAFAAAKARGLEGIMAKDRRSPYQPGLRTLTWQKIKIRPEQELVVGGWTTGIGRGDRPGRAARRRLRPR